MDDKNRFILIIVVAIASLMLMVGGPVVLMYLDNAGQNNIDDSNKKQNSWFNGSQYINSSENWAYIDLSFPGEYVGASWDVSVFGVEGDSRVYIYSMESDVNSSVNGVKLNLENSQIQWFDCFDIVVSVRNETQNERVCLDEVEVR
ncbi:MAG: hypothetical protein C5S33_08385 [ANME-2 cluster archaeon]|jgi:hypothetical protein|nr:hypothetical protein [ANME-2 cluster archaeon]